MRKLPDLIILAGLLVAAIAPSRAELSVDDAGPYPIIIFMSGSVDPSPWPTVTWTPVRGHAAPTNFLNSGGDANGDGPPDFGINPVTGKGEAVWAYWDGTDHEIAFARWDGEKWSFPQLLTNNGADDVHPTIAFGADGSRQISWWRAGMLDQVYFALLPPDDVPGPEEIVARVAVGGLRPGVAVFSGTPYVGYQQPQSGSQTLIVVSHRDGTAWSQENVASTGFTGPAGDGDIDVQTHVSGGKLWADWVDGPGTLGYSEYDSIAGNWGTKQVVTYSWDDSIGLDEKTGRALGRVSLRLRVTK